MHGVGIMQVWRLSSATRALCSRSSTTSCGAQSTDARCSWGLWRNDSKACLPKRQPSLEPWVHALEVMPDHVHLFVESDPTCCPSHLAHQFKGFTSHALRQEFPHLRSRLPTLWSRSSFAASVGYV